MRSSVISLAVLAATASAVTPSLADLLAREDVQPRTPLYECHADCGYTVLDATGDYCKNSTWDGLLDSCLNCALTEDIWQDYGPEVSAAASACGLSAVPSSSSAGGAASTTAVTSSTKSATVTTDTPASAAASSSTASSPLSSVSGPVTSTDSTPATSDNTAAVTSSASHARTRTRSHGDASTGLGGAAGTGHVGATGTGSTGTAVPSHSSATATVPHSGAIKARAASAILTLGMLMLAFVA